jgi:septum site-determining protein MinC
MPENNQLDSDQRPVIEFKSSSITVPTLMIASNDLALIAEQLHNKVKQAPDFFKNSPVLLDLNAISRRKPSIDLGALLAKISAEGLITVGIRGGNERQGADAQQKRIAVFAETRTAPAAPAEPRKTPATIPAEEPETKQRTNAAGETKLVTQPIRSGQRVYSAGDLVILAQVSAGAEIMAEGNIHVYNTLRGRALAGIQGNTSSRIFCSDLQAELISIAGHYRVSEDLDESVRGKPVQIYLDNHTLIINDL